MFMKRLLIVLFIFTLVTSSSCKSHSLVESLPELTNENKFWEETFEIGSSICNINASIEYISAPMQIYNVVPVNFNIKNLKRYLMYFGVSTDSCISFPFIADCQTNSDLAASVVLTATYFSVQLGPYGVIQLEDWIVAGNAYPGEPYGTLLSNVKIEQHEAEELSEKTIIALQINNAVLSNTTKARILAPDNHTITEGWYISYVFNSGSIPFDTAYASPYGDMQFQSSKYTAPWPPQRLDMFIDHEGIKYFRFCNPIEVTGIEKAKLLPLDEIKKIIIDYFKAGYERVNLVEEDVPTITRITLSHSLIKTTGQSSGVLIPTWIVYFTTPYIEENFLLSAVPCINAVDGTRIDPLYE